MEAIKKQEDLTNVETDNTGVTFASEEERMEAINALDENSSIEELDKIRDAEIVVPEKSEENTENQDNLPPTPAPEKELPPPTEQEYTWKGILPGNLDSVGKLAKGYEHGQEHIKKQELALAETRELLAKSQEEIENLRTNKQAPPQPRPEPAKTNALDELNRLQDELLKEEDTFGEGYAAKQRAFMDKQRELLQSMSNKINELESMKPATEKFSSYIQDQEFETQKKRMEVLQDQAYLDYDKIGMDYPEYKATKPYKEVEKEYVEWGTKVAEQALLRPPKNSREIAYAMEKLDNGDADLLRRCSQNGVSIAPPTEDIAKLKDLYFIDDTRTGYRDLISGDWNYNEKGEVVQRMNVNPRTGVRDIPNTYGEGKEGLVNVIENKRRLSGYYRKREHDAAKDAASKLVNAISTRDTNELENDIQPSKHEGTLMSYIKEMESIDVNEIDPAKRKANIDRLQELHVLIEQASKSGG